MLSKEIFIKGLKILSTMKNAINREDEFTINVWYETLKDIPDDAFQKACIYLLKTEIWHPSVSQIREAAGFACDVENGSDTTVEQQWEKFRYGFSQYGRDGFRRAIADGKQVFDDPITQHVAELIFEEYGASDVKEAGNWRARFISTYNNVKQNGRRKAEMKNIGSFKILKAGHKKAVAG